MMSSDSSSGKQRRTMTHRKARGSMRVAAAVLSSLVLTTGASHAEVMYFACSNGQSLQGEDMGQTTSFSIDFSARTINAPTPVPFDERLTTETTLVAQYKTRPLHNTPTLYNDGGTIDSCPYVAIAWMATFNRITGGYRKTVTWFCCKNRDKGGCTILRTEQTLWTCEKTTPKF